MMFATRVFVSLVVLLVVPGTNLLAQVQKVDVPGIRNFSRVDATIGCGGATDATAFPALKKDGFVSIINLRLASEPGVNIDEARAAARTLGLNYVHLPFDASSPDPRVIEAFLAAVATKSNQPAYIHCGSANRVGAVWMIKRVLQDGWPLERARTEAQAIGLRDQQLDAFAVKYIDEHRR
jgi:uncharacterized protein (TIGR01244 family)